MDTGTDCHSAVHLSRGLQIMKEIWKYIILPFTMYLSMPNGAEVLCVQEQHGDIYLWAIVETNSPVYTRKFVMRWTGTPFNGSEGKYIGTVQHSDSLVYHVFEALT